MGAALKSKDERFRLRALWVVFACTILYVGATVSQRLLSEAVSDTSLWRPIVVISLMGLTLTALWFRHYGKAFTRVLLYSGTLAQFSFIAEHGGLTGYQFSSLLAFPPICALLFGSRETVFFAVFFFLGIGALFFADPLLPTFILENAARLPTTTIIISAVSLVTFIVLVIVVSEAEKSEVILRRLLAEQIYAATHDELTDLANRSAVNSFLERLENDTLSAEVYLIDLDGFKSINDNFGHAKGDEVLIRVAQTLKEVAQDADLVARLGGDEFLIAIVRPYGFDQNKDWHTTEFGDRLVEALDLQFVFSSQIARISGSVGSAGYPDDGETSTAVLKKADSALYQAKNAGKSRYVRYAPETVLPEAAKGGAR